MLTKYLQQIQAGKPIHYQKFLQLLPPGFYQRRAELFKVKATGAGKWLLTIQDPILFAALCKSAESPANRLDASLQGNSHRQRTSFSYLLVYHEACQSQRPDVILSQSGRDGQADVSQGFVAKPQVLLIENEENFFQYPVMLTLATQLMAESFTLQNTDVIFAAGSKVGAALLQPVLANYQRILCAFDYDAAGLETFDMLHKRWPDQVQFMAPPDLSPWLSRFLCKPKHPAQLQKAIQLAELHRLFGLVDAFSRTERFLEQEVLLTATAMTV